MTMNKKIKVRLSVTMPIHGALMAKGDIVELDESEARLLVTTDRAEYVEPKKAPIDYKKKGPDENRVLKIPENRGES